MKFVLVATGAFVVALVVPANVRAAPPESSPSIAKPVAGCDDIAIGPDCDQDRTVTTWTKNRLAVDYLFEAFAKELAPTMDGLFLARPSLRHGKARGNHAFPGIA
jgi:hypothetical protein